MEQIDNSVTERIIGCCFKIHKALGPGFVEKTYQNALKAQFEKEGVKFDLEKEFNVEYENKKVGRFRADLVVEDKVILEIKALTGNVPKLFEQQVISYLKSSGLRVGLLVNFGNRSCQIKRFVY